MSDEAAAALAAAAAAPSAPAALGGIDIGRIMASQGPIVKCVLLRAAPAVEATAGAANEEEEKAVTNSRGEAAGGSKDAKEMSAKELKAELASRGVDASSFVEKGELVEALEGARGASKAKKDNNDDGEGIDDGEEAKVVTQDDDGPRDGAAKKEVPLQHLIEEIEIDTTPRKSMVSKVLGGDFTFLGQYEEEGTMVMIRRPDWESEGSTEDAPPVNPHPLQPPLHRVEVRGDILLLRVAETEEELDCADNEEKEEDSKKSEDGGEEDAAKGGNDGAKKGAVHVPTNDEFFLDYTREEYLTFAARTDIVAEEVASSSDEESEVEADDDDAKPRADDEDDSEEDEAFDPDDDSDEGDVDEEHQVGMMNMILGHMLRKFREANGRGPDSIELLEMRKALADRLGVAVPPVDEAAHDQEADSPGKEGRPSVGKRVVMDEERNETKEIPCRPQREEEGDEDEDEDKDDDAEDVSDLVVMSLKRAAQDVADGPGNKRVRMDEVSGSCTGDGKENEES